MELQNKITEGIHLDMDINVYHADKEFVSASSVKEGIKSMAHFNLQRTKPSERKSHFDFGNVFEIALLDSINGTRFFDEKVIIFDVENRPEQTKGITSNINQEWKKGILNGLKYVIEKTGAESMETLHEMLQSCMRDATIQKVLKNTTYQESYFWTDKTTGLKCKSRPDLRKNGKGIIIDIKTTKDGSPKAFAKDVANLEYPIQAVMQMKGAIQSGAVEKMESYYWLAVEKVAPYNVTLYEFQMDDWQFVDDKLTYYMTKIKESLDSCIYKGYSAEADNQLGIISLELPMYYRF